MTLIIMDLKSTTLADYTVLAELPPVVGVPKGSYASNPDGSSHILEFRQMVRVVYCSLFLFSFIM
jgi:hypothetical protein